MSLGLRELFQVVFGVVGKVMDSREYFGNKDFSKYADILSKHQKDAKEIFKCLLKLNKSRLNLSRSSRTL
jgi:hypothetical protein